MIPANPRSPTLLRVPFADLDWQERPSGRLACHPAVGAALAAGGLDSIAALSKVRAPIVAEHRRTIVRLLEVPGANDQGANVVPVFSIYLKINQEVDRKDLVRRLLVGRRRDSAAATEWRNLAALAAIGIETPVPVLIGEVHGPLGERKSLLGTLALVGVRPLDGLLADMLPADRQRLLLKIARIVRTMHDAGLTHPDLYARHIFADDAGFRVAVIDVQRTRHFGRLRTGHRIRDLAALDVSIGPGVATSRARLRLLVEYDRAPNGRARLPRRELKRVARGVCRRRQILIKRGRGIAWSEGAIVIEEIHQELPDGRLIGNAACAREIAEIGIPTIAAVFDDALHAGRGQLLRRLPDRDNVLLLRPSGTFFLKRHQSLKIAWGLVEWRNARRLAAIPVAIALPICAGVDDGGRSFVITKGLAGEPLDDLLRRGRPTTALARELGAELAIMVARLHGAGFGHRDLYLCHVFADTSRSVSERLTLIDLQRVAPLGKWRPSRWRVKDLAALAYSAIALPISDRDRARVFIRYWRELGRGRGRSRRREFARIAARAQRLLAAHGVPAAPTPRQP